MQHEGSPVVLPYLRYLKCMVHDCSVISNTVFFTHLNKLFFFLGVKGQGMAVNRNPMGGNTSTAGAASLASSEVEISQRSGQHEVYSM